LGAAVRRGEDGVSREDIAGRRRDQLVDATIAVMGRRGWQRTSISEVTREAGVSRGLASYHFRDKSELLSAVLARCRAKFRSAVLEGAAQGTPPEQLRTIIRLAVAQIREDPVVYLVFLHFTAAEPSVPELGAQIRGLWREFREEAAAGIRAGQASGHYRPDLDAQAAAAQLFGAIVGLALQWLLDPESFDLDAAGRAVEAQFLSDIVVSHTR
jgi:AcrR family transcriptional regulator